MATYNLGRVVPIFRGGYENGTAYSYLDVVLYHGDSFVAKGDTKGNLPTDEEYWQLMCEGVDEAVLTQHVLDTIVEEHFVQDADYVHTDNNLTDDLKQKIINSLTTISWSEVTGKPETFTPSAHTHTTSEITDMPDVNDGTVTIMQGSVQKGQFSMNQSSNTTVNIDPIPETIDWDNVTDKPQSFTPSSHTHTKSEITDFPETIDWDNVTDKPQTFTPSSHTHTTSDITDMPDVNDATITIMQGGVQKGQFTLNQDSNATINLQEGHSQWFGTQAQYDAIATKDPDTTYYIEGSLPVVNDGTVTINQGGVLKGQFTLNQAGNTTIDLGEGLASVDWDDVNNKPSTFTPSSHTHTASEITDLPTTVSWSSVTDKPSTFTPSSHTHTTSEITDMPTIPTVNDATITINQGGVQKGQFTLNQSGNATINLQEGNSQWFGTQAQYDALTTKDPNTNYYIEGADWYGTKAEYNAIVTKDASTTYYIEGDVEWTEIANKPSTFTPSAHTHTTSEITDMPTIPTVNDATVTINQGSTQKGTFTLNQSSNVTINLDEGGSNDWFGTQAQYDAIVTKDPDVVYHVKGTTPKEWFGTQAEYDAIVTKDPNTEYHVKGTTPKEWFGTQAEYDAITTKDPNTMYHIKGGIDWDDIDDKPSTFTPSSHTHTTSDITDMPTVNDATITIMQGSVQKGQFTLNQSGNATITLQEGHSQWFGTQAQYDAITTKDPDTTYYVENGIDWSEINNKPSTFTPSSHTHTENDLTGWTAEDWDFTFMDGTTVTKYILTKPYSL